MKMLPIGYMRLLLVETWATIRVTLLTRQPWISLVFKVVLYLSLNLTLHLHSGGMKAEGYGRYEKFIDNSKVAEPSKERIEEIKVLEGLQEPFAFQTNQHTLQEEELERSSAKYFIPSSNYTILMCSLIEHTIQKQAMKI